jgi:chromosome partitioning protein
MVSQRGLGWPGGTGLRAPDQVRADDAGSGLVQGSVLTQDPVVPRQAAQPSWEYGQSPNADSDPDGAQRSANLGWPMDDVPAAEPVEVPVPVAVPAAVPEVKNNSPRRVREALDAAVSRETRAESSRPAARRPNARHHAQDDGQSGHPGYPAPAYQSGQMPPVVMPEQRPMIADTPIARAAEAAVELRTGGGRPWPRPRSCRMVTVANQKGGVGKTTTAVNIAASLALHGSRVLVIDLDPQGNASTALDVEHRVGTPSVYNVLVEDQPLAEIIQPVEGIPLLRCAPATIDLAGAEIELVPLVARESRLARAIASYDSSGLDYIFVDCPPSLGLLTVNSLVAAAEVLIPIQCEYYALEGLEQLLRTVDLVKGHLNANLWVSTILLTMYDARTRLAAQVADDVRSHFGNVVLGSVIPRSVRVSEAPSYGQSVMTYDPGSTGALAYLEAAREIANQNVVSR